MSSTLVFAEPPRIFSAIKARWLLGILLLSWILPGVLVAMVWPQWVHAGGTPIPDTVAFVGGYVLWAGGLWVALGWKGQLRRLSLGAIPHRGEQLVYALLGVPMIGLALLSIYLVYYPLSFISPEFVTAWVLEMPPLIWWRSDPGATLGNLANALTLVVIAPVVEELFFRGFLLNRWRQKFGVVRAIIFSAIPFALLHVDFLGALVFSAVASLIYLRTGSLLGPIIVHASNNTLVLLALIIEGLVTGEVASTTLAEFRSLWWLGLLGAAVGLPWLIWFLRRLLGNVGSVGPQNQTAVATASSE